MAIISSRPRVALLKTRFRKAGARSLAERGSVIGANLWRLSQELYRHLENDGFRFSSDRMVIEVLTEFIAFQIQLIDRALYGRLTDADRATLIGEAVRHLAKTMENNQLDLLGPGNYRTAFIDQVNARSGEYAEFEFTGGEPAALCLRYFATRVADVMASAGNKWVVEQVIEIEAPEMIGFVRRLVDQTLGTPGD